MPQPETKSLLLANSREALRATLRNVGHAKNSQLPPFDLLHSQAALEIMQSVHVDRNTRLDVRVQAASRVKPAVMVSRDDDFYLMRLALQPIKLLLYICSGPRIGQVARVDENVARRDIDELVVRVRYADDSDGWSAARRNERLASEEEKDVIEPDGDECQWREEKLVEESEALPLVLPAKAEEREKAHGEGKGSTEN